MLSRKDFLGGPCTETQGIDAEESYWYRKSFVVSFDWQFFLAAPENQLVSAEFRQERV